MLRSIYSKFPVLRRIAELPSSGFHIRGFAKCYPIGVDMGDDALTIVQLENNKKGFIGLVAGGSKNRPEDIELGSSDWQRWAVETIRELTANGQFRGKDVIATIPASEVFIDHIKMPKTEKDKMQNAVFAEIKQKLPFKPDDAMIKFLPAEDDNVLVMAAERKKIDRHLAIYEKAGLKIKSIVVWPTALTNNYVSFFGRRKSDVEVVVMLLDINMNYTNVAICRHNNPLFARSIPIGAKQLEEASDCGQKHLVAGDDEAMAKLVFELTACKRRFSSMHEKAQIERLIFLSSQTVDRDIYIAMAKQLEMPAQMGDCLAAVETTNLYRLGVDRRECEVNWITAFGLSLS
ncbi:MAG: type II secretion system protein GspL [Phycisphaerae bacterium]|nr:type II secretion system protein GspL [Phycisphaerae bacterium]